MRATQDRMGGTDYMSENQERPPFQQNISANDHYPEQEEPAAVDPGQAQQMQQPAYEAPEGQMQEEPYDEEPSKMFTFEENQQKMQQHEQERNSQMSPASVRNEH